MSCKLMLTFNKSYCEGVWVSAFIGQYINGV